MTVYFHHNRMAYRALTLILLIVMVSIAVIIERVDSIKEVFTVVSIILTTLLTIKKFWKGEIVAEDKRPLLSNLPREPSHFFQPRTEEVKHLKEKLHNLEKTNPGNVAKTVYITGDPATGKTQLARQFGKEFFDENKHKNKKLFVGFVRTVSVDNILQNYLQIAHDLDCVKEETEVTIRSGQLMDYDSLKMLTVHVKKELRERPGWLLIVDGLSLDESLLEKVSTFWPQPKDESWGRGYVIATTQGPAPTGSCIDVMDLRSGMSEKDAVELLTTESGCSNKEGAVELVNSLDRSPLSVAR